MLVLLYNRDYYYKLWYSKDKQWMMKATSTTTNDSKLQAWTGVNPGPQNQAKQCNWERTFARGSFNEYILSTSNSVITKTSVFTQWAAIRQKKVWRVELNCVKNKEQKTKNYRNLCDSLWFLIPVIIQSTCLLSHSFSMHRSSKRFCDTALLAAPGNIVIIECELSFVISSFWWYWWFIVKFDRIENGIIILVYQAK